MENLTIPAFFRAKHPRRAGGFTLVELLVVIVIIAILATIAIVATRGIRQKAMQANAVSTMRQIATISAAYSIENNGDINRMIDEKENKLWTGATWVSKSYWGRLQPYLYPDIDIANQGKLRNEIKSRLGSLFGTSDLSTMAGTFLQGSKVAGDKGGIPIPFGFNRYVCGWNELKKVQNFSDSSQTLYFTYGHWTFDENDGKKYFPMPVKDPAQESNIYYFDNKTVAAAFLDGHMEILSPPIPDRRFK